MGKCKECGIEIIDEYYFNDLINEVLEEEKRK